MNEVCHGLEAKSFSVIILAGGQSRRMGTDKAVLPWEQGSILSSLLARLFPLSDDVLVVGNIVRNLSGMVRQVADIIPQKGPLSGIHSGLIYARHDLVFVTACDVPFLVPDLVSQLVNAVGVADGSVAVYKRQVEPLFACYHKKCAGVIQQMLVERKYKVTDFLDKIDWVPVRHLDEVSPWCFMNVNTGNDYEKAKAILARGK